MYNVQTDVVRCTHAYGTRTIHFFNTSTSMHTCGARIISYYDNYAYLIGYLFVSFCHGEWWISYTWRWSLHRVWKWRTALCFLQVDANAFWSHDWCEGARRHSRPETCAIVAAPQFRCKHFVPKSSQTQRYANTFQIGKTWKNSLHFSPIHVEFIRIYMNLWHPTHRS